MNSNRLFKHIPWFILGIIGAFCLGVVALRRGEHVSALWIIVASVSVYLVAYRYYSLYIATKVMKLDPTRSTPAVINNDGLNYVPTNRNVLFGHHFAAIAGAGPLVGPVLAAQMGYLPGTLWLLAGVVLAGRYRTLWCCLSPRAVMVHLWVRLLKKRWEPCRALSRSSAAS
ncbi:Inner membrane protein YjiY [Morganella morganii]|nr:Inner membrane protein YjiY [Morganella morganii]